MVQQMVGPFLVVRVRVREYGNEVEHHVRFTR